MQHSVHSVNYPVFKRGFTLLEVLIAILVLAILVGIVFRGFSAVTSTMVTAQNAAETLRSRQTVWRNLSENVQGIYADGACLQPEYKLVGTSEEGPFGPADTLRFATSLPMRGANALPGITKVVTYSVVDQSEAGDDIVRLLPVDEERPGEILLIREEPLLLESDDFSTQDAAEMSEAYEQGVPVASMDILYFDGMENEWVEEWDSISQRRLPGGIWFKINFPRSEEERQASFSEGIDLQESADLELMMSLPLGRDVEFPFPDFNNLRLLMDEEEIESDT